MKVTTLLVQITLSDTPEDLKERPIVGGPNSPAQGISGLLEKILTPTVSCLKTYIKDDWDFTRKNYHLVLIIPVLIIQSASQRRLF